ncbi:MAG: hypothetical protein ACFCUR_15250 [Rhodomicrobiaceae bacterium]
MSERKITTDHEKIKKWAAMRGAVPSTAGSTEQSDRGTALRFGFQNKEEDLEPLSWDEFFAAFERNNLAFLYQDRTATGRASRFHKFVARNTRPMLQKRRR